MSTAQPTLGHLVPLDSIIVTDELRTRVPHPRSDIAVNEAIVGLSRTMANAPKEILQRLVDTSLSLCDAHSAGISLLEEENGKEIFRWHGIAGRYKPYLWGTTPREFSPCGTVLDRDAVQLMAGLDRHFTYFAEVTPRIEEALLVPFHVAGKAVGTIWVISHESSRKFDAGDLAALEMLGEFAAAAFQVYRSQINLEEANAELLRCNQELTQTQAQLTVANANLEQFALAAGHDLQEPLRTITTMTELLRYQIEDKVDASTSNLFLMVIDGARRMKKLLDGILQYAQISQSDPEPSQEFSLSDAVGNATANLHKILQDEHAEITCGVLPNIFADHGQISLVLQNLILNSVKYRRKDVSPLIQISAEPFGGDWTVSVKDNGEGFSEEYAQSIFGVFKRLHGHDIPGSGMGLALCQKIVQRHGGTMRASSVPGEGSVFSFTLPAATIT
jgi:signal transduction histidine kinase